MSDDYRKLLQELETDQQRTFDTTVISLSGGALGVSFAFVKDFIAPSSAIDYCYLLAAWYCWAFSIMAMLTSHFVSVEMLRSAMRALDAKETPKRAAWLDRVTFGLNIAGGVSFVAGVVLLAAFVGVNLGKQHDQASGAAAATAASATSARSAPDAGRGPSTADQTAATAPGPTGSAPANPADAKN
jgi:hypothetical protein